MANYNGWPNRQTWNVALWIGNDEGLYHLAKECVRQTLADDENASPYAAFVDNLRDSGITETPDHVAYNDSSLDTDELDSMMRDL